MTDYKDVAAGLMSLTPDARLQTLAMSKKLMDPDAYEAWRGEVTAAARTLRAAGARPVGSAPVQQRQLADHERRSIQRSAQAIARAHAAGRPGARTMAEIGKGTPRTSAPAHPNSADYQAVLQQSGVRPETGRSRYRNGFYTGGGY